MFEPAPESPRYEHPSVEFPDGFIAQEGWRTWRIRADGTLHSINKLSGESWPARTEIRAVCSKERPHASPAEDCSCGVYASTSPLEASDVSGLGPGIVVGTVSLWGRLLPYTKGYKSEYAYPKELYLHPTLWHLRPALQKKYGVPVYSREFVDPLIAALHRRRTAHQTRQFLFWTAALAASFLLLSFLLGPQSGMHAWAGLVGVLPLVAWIQMMREDWKVGHRLHPFTAGGLGAALGLFSVSWLLYSAVTLFGR